jgi:hypothetical protein
MPTQERLIKRRNYIISNPEKAEADRGGKEKLRSTAKLLKSPGAQWMNSNCLRRTTVPAMRKQSKRLSILLLHFSYI